MIQFCKYLYDQSHIISWPNSWVNHSADEWVFHPLSSNSLDGLQMVVERWLDVLVHHPRPLPPLPPPCCPLHFEPSVPTPLVFCQLRFILFVFFTLDFRALFVMFSSLVGLPSLFDELLTARYHRCLMFYFFKNTSLKSFSKQPLHIGWQSTLYRACTSVTDLQDVLYLFRRDVNVLGWAAQLGPPLRLRAAARPSSASTNRKPAQPQHKAAHMGCSEECWIFCQGFHLFFPKTFEKDLFNVDQSQAGATATHSNCPYMECSKEY